MNNITETLKNLINRGCPIAEAKSLIYGNELTVSREEKVQDNNNRINALMGYGYSLEEAKNIIYTCED